MLRAIPRPTFGPLAGRRARALARRVAPAALARLGGPGEWRLGAPFSGRGDTCVFAVHGPGADGTGAALLKAAASRQGRLQLERQVAVLAALHADDRLGPWARLVPRTLCAGAVDDGADGGADGVTFAVESRLPGTDPRGLPDAGAWLVPAALGALDGLAARTAAVAPVDPGTVRRWVREPAGHVRAVLRGGRGGDGPRAALDRLEAELVAGLAGRAVARGWAHGDYNRTNVLLEDGPARVPVVSGVVDWPEGEPDGLVGADAVTLLLSEDMAAGRGRGGELGPVLLRRLADPAPLDEVVARAQRRVGGEELPVRTMLLLSWLRHVGGNLADSTRYAANPVWMHRNVRTVLAGL